MIAVQKGAMTSRMAECGNDPEIGRKDDVLAPVDEDFRVRL